MKFNLATTILGTTLGLGLAANMPSAHAGSFIPHKEGEIKTTNLGCITSACINTQAEMGYTVTSLEYKDTEGKTQKASRLFVDTRSTANDYGSGVKFGKQDAGTNTNFNEYWLRPVAYNSNGSVAEGGQLEVGRFQFDFADVISTLSLDFFDVEDAFKSGILSVNGTAMSQLLNKGPDGNRQSLTLKNVSSFVVQLGNRGKMSFNAKTGDGVSLSGMKSVPEPGSVVGLGALAVAGVFGLRQRKKVSLG